MTALHHRLVALAAEHELPEGAPERLEAVLLELQAAEISVSSVRQPETAVEVHVADSLTALALPELRDPAMIADLGAGGGFPGFALAVARPRATVRLVESVGKKCDFLARAARAAGLVNVEVIRARAEDWRAGIGAHDVVTARALAPLPVLVEYAAPLLRVGGALVAWKGEPDPVEVADGRAAASALGLEPRGVVPVEHTHPSSRRTLHVYSKALETPPGYPRRAGMARKRPFRSST